MFKLKYLLVFLKHVLAASQGFMAHVNNPLRRVPGENNITNINQQIALEIIAFYFNSPKLKSWLKKTVSYLVGLKCKLRNYLNRFFWSYNFMAS